ncbi:hypothetical protein D9757_012411 [Collybiopsis confluens]|uniref:Uncharacterized protein n=1 Tax=Collybiopsis confluens TaxID=2823264 RepID=A0A8H5H0V4_9AGAR|nr:hypothetical protein D9757_012411 [Collybiopsis confluens]
MARDTGNELISSTEASGLFVSLEDRLRGTDGLLLLLEEALARYADNDPGQSGTAYTFGLYAFELLAGYDCPTYATIPNATFHADEISTTHPHSPPGPSSPWEYTSWALRPHFGSLLSVPRHWGLPPRSFQRLILVLTAVMSQIDGGAIDPRPAPSHHPTKEKRPLKPKRSGSKPLRRSLQTSSSSKATPVPKTPDPTKSSNADPGDNDNDDNDDNDGGVESRRKRGHKGSFHGARLQFLQSSLLEYVKAKPRGPCFAQICDEWFKKWPWHDSDQPPESFRVLESQDGSMSDETRSKLEAELKQAQAAIQIAGKGVTIYDTQLARWFWRNAKKASEPARVNSTPLVPLLRKALGFSGAAPRRSILYKMWMKHPENKTRVQEALQARLAEEPAGKALHLKIRCQVAEELFEQEPESVKKEVEEEMARVYQTKIEMFKKIVSGGSVTLEELGEDENAEETREIINSGDSGGANPQTFQNWNNEYFLKNVISLFMLFLCNQDPKDVLGEPGLIHPDSDHAAPEESIDDTSLIRMSNEPNETGTTTRKRQRKRRKKQKTKETEDEEDEEDEERSEDEEEVIRDQNGKWVRLQDVRGSIIETRPRDIVVQHFEAESTPELDERPLPDILKTHLPAMLTEARRDIIGMLNSQSGSVWDHNVKVLTRKAEAWKAEQATRPPSPSSGSVPSDSGSLGETAKSLAPPVANKSVRFRHTSQPLHSTNDIPANVFQLEDHDARLVSSAETERALNTPIRFGSVPPRFPADSGDMSWLPPHFNPIMPSQPNTDVNLNPEHSSRHRPTPQRLPRGASNSPLAEHTPSNAPKPVGPASTQHAASSSNKPEEFSAAQGQSPVEPNDLSDCPAWLVRAVTALGGLEQDRTEWRNVLHALVILERLYEFRDPTGKSASFTAAKGVRPPLVEWYFKNRKNVAATLNHDFTTPTVEKLGNDLVINPEWRERDNEHRIVPRGEGEGSWDGVHRPGQCGMVTVLLCARWWFLRVSDNKQQMDKCLLLLSDIQAVMEDMAYEGGAYDGRRKRKAPASAPSSHSRPVQRSRVKTTMTLESFTRSGICTPIYYSETIPGLVQTKRSHEYYVITEGSFAGVYKYWNLAKERADRSGKIARGVANLEAACDVWGWSCKEYHKHDNRDSMSFTSAFIESTYLESSTLKGTGAQDRPEEDGGTGDNETHDAELDALNKYAKPNPPGISATFSTSANTLKSHSSKIMFYQPQNSSLIPTATPNSSRSRPPSPTKPSLSQKIIKPTAAGEESISARLSAQSIGKGRSGRSKTSNGLYVVKWGTLYELHTSINAAKEAFERAQTMENTVTMRYSPSWDAAMAFANDSEGA